MNIFSIFASLLSAFWWMIPIGIILLYFKSPSGKGVIGECIVNISAKVMLDSSVYHLCKNVTLPTEDGTTQIDHIIVSRFGVFVIETKNYAGWIFGNENQKMWTQKFHRSSNRFQNPLHQNYKHVRTLESILGLEKELIYSVVVFVGDSTFKTEMPDNVVKSGEYIRFIKSKIHPVLTDEQVCEIINRIQSGRLTPSLKVNQEHVQHVQKIVAKKSSSPLNSGTLAAAGQASTAKACPKCGGNLVRRTSKSGARTGMPFWGCAEYPSCRFIQNIE